MSRLAAIFGVAVLLTATPVFAQKQITSELVASGFDHPVAFVQDPAHPNLQLVVEQHGHVRALLGGVIQGTDFLDLSGIVSTSAAEAGLLGLAFAPDYGSTGRFFVHFIDVANNNVIARFRTGADPLRADADSRMDLVWPDGQAFIAQENCCHYGGRLAFGPDGMLYISLGDGGARDDAMHNAQNPGTLLGKILRIDVSVGDADPEGYDVPANNPFVGQAGVLGEIWDLGLRNPFSFSFDDPARGGTGALIIADVGQDTWEEINYEPALHGGRNFGWRLREGANDYLLDLPAWSDSLTDPTFQYSHDIGACIIGGVVYRGTALGPGLHGRYFFGDFTSGALWSTGLSVDPLSGEATPFDVIEHTNDVGDTSLHGVVAISEDAAGELYYLNWSNGELYRLVAPVVPVSTCETADPFAGMGGGACVNGGWLPPGLAPPPPVIPTMPTSTGATGTTTITGMTGGPVTPSPVVNVVTCAGTAPVSGWVCVDGGWLPPNHPLAIAAAAGGTSTGGAGSPSSGAGSNGAGSSSGSTGSGGSGNSSSGSATPPAPVSVVPCPGTPPVSGWVCVNGGWLPPDHPLAIAAAAGGGTSGGAGSSSSGAGSNGAGGSSGSTGSSGSGGSGNSSSGAATPPAPVTVVPCLGTAPVSGWVCVNGGWLPANHPLAIAAATNSGTANGGSSGTSPSGSGSGSSTSPGSAFGCIGPDPFAGIPGLHGICINGGWIPVIGG